MTSARSTIPTGLTEVTIPHALVQVSTQGPFGLGADQRAWDAISPQARTGIMEFYRNKIGSATPTQEPPQPHLTSRCAPNSPANRAPTMGNTTLVNVAETETANSTTQPTLTPQDTSGTQGQSQIMINAAATTSTSPNRLMNPGDLRTLLGSRSVTYAKDTPEDTESEASRRRKRGICMRDQVQRVHSRIVEH